MNKIFKYRIENIDQQEIEIPEGGKILTVQKQHEMAFIWVLVDPENKPEKRVFVVVGTGSSFNRYGYDYIGTYQMADGALVWHLFEFIQ